MIVYIFFIFAIGVIYFSLLSRYAKLWNGIEEPMVGENEISVSILIPFRNEEHHLGRLLKSLNEQDIGRSSCEVILINDDSTDGSLVAIANAKLAVPYKIINNAGNGKKDALKEGWTHAKGEVILQTDADCLVSKNWLQCMIMPFSNEDTILVSGPVRFSEGTNFWQRMVMLDFGALIASGAAHIAWGKPLMCNGANLAYRKSLISNFKFTGEKASGDDVFLLQYAHQLSPNGIAFVKKKEALVSTNGPASFNEFWHQRIRWASKNGDNDKKENTTLLIFVWLYNVVILGSLLSCSGVGATGAAFLILLKVIAEDTFYSAFAYFFGWTGWFKTIVLGQPFHILYMALLPPMSQFFKYRWKGRKLK